MPNVKYSERSSRNGCIRRGETGREPAFHDNNN